MTFRHALAMFLRRLAELIDDVDPSIRVFHDRCSLIHTRELCLLLVFYFILVVVLFWFRDALDHAVAWFLHKVSEAAKAAGEAMMELGEEEVEMREENMQEEKEA